MKRLLLAPLLITLIVGCSTTDKSKTDKTFIERRDACADALGGSISWDEFDKKYNLNKNGNKKDIAARHGFCSFYRIGNIN